MATKKTLYIQDANEDALKIIDKNEQSFGAWVNEKMAIYKKAFEIKFKKYYVISNI